MDKINPFFGAGAVQSLIERPKKNDNDRPSAASDAPAFDLNGGAKGDSLTLVG